MCLLKFQFLFLLLPYLFLLEHSAKAQLFGRAAACIRKNDLTLKDFRKDWQQDNDFKTFISTALKEFCVNFFEHAMPHARMRDLLSFEDPAISLGDVKPMIETYLNEHNESRKLTLLRNKFQELLVTFGPNAVFSQEICNWLNSKNTTFDTEFRPKIDTVFSLAVALGDLTCIQIAMGTGARVDHCRSDFTASALVQRCLWKNDWQLKLARGLDIRTEDCNAASKLGSGSFAAVYKSSINGEPRAMKQFHATFDNLPMQGTLDNVVTEVQLMLQCQHRNVVKCFGFFLWDIQFPKTKPCLLLELMMTTVSHLLLDPSCEFSDDEMRLQFGSNEVYNEMQVQFASKDVRIQIMCDAAAGLEYLHGCIPPIIHRDIKPGNILLKLENGKLCVKLSDFGLSSSNKNYTTRTMTQGGSLRIGTRAAGAGTPAFMSVEQWDTSTMQSTKADVFSFALTLFAVVCKVTEPWFDLETYVTLLKGNGEFYEFSQIRSCIENCNWPVWHNKSLIRKA